MSDKRKILFACDLDNTLIHSYKNKKDGDVCVEWLDGQEQGYMDGQAYEMLGELAEYALFVPVTTRSIEQYKRIRWKDNVEPKYAVTTNGAILLEGGEADAAWLARSKAEACGYRAEMERLLQKLLAQGEYTSCKIVDGMYLFAAYRDDNFARNMAARHRELTSLAVAISGRKIYFLPPRFNKGEALQRLRERWKPECAIAAGDSAIDVPMLNLADIAFYKEWLTEQVNSGEKVVFEDEKDLICKVVSKLKEWR